MSEKLFLAAVILLSLLIIGTTPPLVRPFLQHESTPTSTTVAPTPTLTLTPTVDPFASVPTATSQARRFIAVQLPTATLGDAPPTFTATPEQVTAEKQVVLLPDPQSAATAVDGVAPERLEIPGLKIEAKIQPVDLVPVSELDGAVAGGMPSEDKNVGWVTDSAPFGQTGNTVLIGYPQAGAAFYKLWTLEAGDLVILSAGAESQQYFVSDVLVLVEDQGDPEGRISSAKLVNPTVDERLTLVTGGEESEAQRTVIIAKPGGGNK